MILQLKRTLPNFQFNNANIIMRNVRRHQVFNLILQAKNNRSTNTCFLATLNPCQETIESSTYSQLVGSPVFCRTRKKRSLEDQANFQIPESRKYLEYRVLDDQISPGPTIAHKDNAVLDFCKACDIMTGDSV